MIRYTILGFLLFTAVFMKPAFTQTSSSAALEDTLRFMFYNVENLFDPFDDSLKRDDEFTSNGARHWSWRKFQTKLNHIYKTIVAAGNPLPPVGIGLCEIENRFVLNQLVYKTPFSKFNYRIVHEESPDRRGIDVAFLFDPNRFVLLGHEVIPIRFPFDTNGRTRDILYVKGLVFNTDTVHIFVNHWPSRWGGQMATDPKRKYVADILKHKTDSLFSSIDEPNIIIMGDFNDYPTDESISLHLKAGSVSDSTKLINLMLPFTSNYSFGSHKYHDEWGTLDQIIISKFLLLPSHSLQVHHQEAFILDASFLLIPDEKFLGQKPFRTFVGFKYVGGFSDHLPVYFDLYRKK